VRNIELFLAHAGSLMRIPIAKRTPFLGVNGTARLYDEAEVE
jgi:hypothetical protein